MKLKLETQDQVTLLLVTETIEPAQLPVLRAGITKLFQSGKKKLLLDLTAIPEAMLQTVAAEVSELRNWAVSQGADLVVVSPLVGSAKSRGEGIALLTSPLAKQQAQEMKLRAELQSLEQQKSKLNQTLGQLGADEELRKVRTRNSELKKNILEAEKIARKYFTKKSKRPAAGDPGEFSALTVLLDDFLKKEGVLP